MSRPGDHGEKTELDNLCAMCVPMFDGSFFWNPPWSLYPFHDINSLSTSADASCHVCNLLLSQIRPKVMEQLQCDLDASAVTLSQQLRIRLFLIGSRQCTLLLLARSAALRDYGNRKTFDGYFEIGQLTIRPAKDDCTNGSRSTEIWNCSDSTTAQITGWLGQCIKSHTRCFDAQIIAATRELLPTRLLDLRRATQENCIQLVKTTILPRNTLYATLSHCWGGRCDTILTVENLQGFEKGLPLNCIPRTFQDAVSVSIRLGVRYLWIDALCIVQDSVDDLDWKHEASIMGDVYANSYFTLAATESINSRGGLLQKRNPTAAWPCRLLANWGFRDSCQVVISPPGLGQKMDLLPLGTRAWAFQEWLLSKRLIHFSKYEVRWECHTLAATEVYPTGFDEDDIPGGVSPTKTIIPQIRDHSTLTQGLWERIQQEYSSKALTKASDKLAAFSGVARMVLKALKSPSNEYLAGMWKPRLHAELLWVRNGDQRSPYETSIYIAPTWSWASLNGAFQLAFELPCLNDERAESQWNCEVLDTKLAPVDDVFGPVKDGSLTLRTWICQIEVCSPTYPFSVTELSDGWNLLAINGVAVSYFGTAQISMDHPSPQMRRLSVLLCFYFIPIRATFNRDKSRRRDLAGLLLRRTGKKRGQYYRVGVFRLFIRDDKEDKALLQFEEQDNIEPASYLDYPLPGVKAVEIV